MMERFFGFPDLGWMWPIAICLIVTAISYLIRNSLLRMLSRWAKRTRTGVDDIVISSIKRPSLIWCVMLGLYITILFSKIPEKYIILSGKFLFVLAIISVTLVLSNILIGIIRTYSKRVEFFIPVSSLTQNIGRIVVYGIGILIILNSLGISITPILATLGVGGLAVALALQDTLANLFSGFYISMARHIRVGDFIKLESGEEGYVLDIGWRATRIRMLPNNVVLIPNNKLSQTIITNYYLPEKELAVLVQVGVHYNSDLEYVEKVTIEVAKEVMREVHGGVSEFEPFIRYHTFSDFSINFTVILRAKEFVDQYLIKHEFVKRLHKRYAKEGIVIPYPIRAINYEQEEGPK